MKELLEHLACYNAWANQRLSEATFLYPESVLQQNVGGSFPSIRSTILHMLDAESIWWQRLKLKEIIKAPSNQFAGETKEAFKLLAEQNKSWKAWVEQASLAALKHEFSYRNMKSEKFTQPVGEVLIHVFNHATYHRGQWVNQLRECGVTKIPSTDYIEFSRRGRT